VEDRTAAAFAERAADHGVNQPQEKWGRDICAKTFKLALMDDLQRRKSRLEIGHVLFIDIAGYSKLTTEEESEALPGLKLLLRILALKRR
jgi:hypothetical protein